MVFALRYEMLIRWIVHQCPAPDKFAHTYAGMTLWLGAALVTRRPLRSGVPILFVVVAELVNEMIDRVAHGSWMWHDTLTDMAATWFWPVILAGLFRWVPSLRR